MSEKQTDHDAIMSPPLVPQVDSVSVSDFVAYMPGRSYVFTPTGEFWPGASVNARIAPIADGAETIAPSKWLEMNSRVEQATWAPGEPMLIRDRLISDGGWIDRAGCTVFNFYRPPTIVPKAGSAKPWLDHLRRVYPNDADHIMKWLAQRVQRPQEKINHALVFGGVPGIGKDTILEPVKQAIGPWNFTEVSPRNMLGRFNGFLKSVILRVSEVRDLGEVDRFAFHDHLKAYTAAPPDVLRIDEKHLREYAALNVVGIILTSNHKTDGIYLPPDDRRHYVAWSDLELSDIAPNYFPDIYNWFANGGNESVAHHLATLDISGFNPKAPPPKTQAFWEIVDASRTPEDAELNDVLDTLERPKVVTISQIIARAPGEFAEWLRDRKSRGRIPHRFTKCGYATVRNPDAADGLWKVGGKRQVIYGRSDLSIHDRTGAAYVLTGSH